MYQRCEINLGSGHGTASYCTLYSSCSLTMLMQSRHRPRTASSNPSKTTPRPNHPHPFGFSTLLPSHPSPSNSPRHHASIPHLRKRRLKRMSHPQRSCPRPSHGDPTFPLNYQSTLRRTLKNPAQTTKMRQKQPTMIPYQPTHHPNAVGPTPQKQNP